MLCTTEPDADTDEMEPLAGLPRSFGSISCESLEGLRRIEGRLISFALRSLRMLLLSLTDVVCLCDFLGLSRGMRLLLGVLGLLFGLLGWLDGLEDAGGPCDGEGAERDASDSGCDTQSSDRESSQACDAIAAVADW